GGGAGDAGDGEGAPDPLPRLAVEDLDGPARRPRARSHDEVGNAVAGDVPRRHRHAAGEAREREEAPDLLVARAVEDLDVSARRPRARPHDEVGLAVAGDVAGRHADAAGEAGEGEEAPDLLPRLAVEDLDVSARRPGARAGDDVGEAVAIGVAGGHAAATREARPVSEKAADLRAGHAVEDLDVPARRPGARAGDDVGDAVAREAAVGQQAEVDGPGEAVDGVDRGRGPGA